MKRRLYYIAIAVAIFTMYFVADSYGLFETVGSGSASEDVSDWVISLNGIDISKGYSSTLVINELNYSDNANVADGYIAPGRDGTFNIELDPAGTQVAVRYDITIDFESVSYADNINFTVEGTSDEDVIMTGEHTYTGVIDLANIDNDSIIITLGLTWINDETHNEDDTELGKNANSKLSIPVTFEVTQYLGEEITPYE